MQGEQYQAEGSMPVAEGTVVQGEPVMVSGTLVQAPGVQPYGVQPTVVQPTVYKVQQPPIVYQAGVVQPAALAPAGRWLGGNACGWCDPPGGCGLCCITAFCPCIVVGQLWHRIVERGGGGTVLAILAAVSVTAWVLEQVVDNILYPIQVGWVFRLIAGFIYLHYVLKIRQKAAEAGGFQDHAVLCGNECCETYWCLPCIACFLMRHDIQAKQPGAIYQGCGTMAGTVYDLPA